jgi:ABC-type protease/lipase transport system fused ATPase/permease subunit
MGKLSIGTIGVIGFACLAVLMVTAVVLVSLVIVAPAYSLEVWQRLRSARTGVARVERFLSVPPAAPRAPSWLPEPSNDR